MPTPNNRPTGIRTPMIFGVTIIATFFGGLMLWAALAPLESAAIAVGSVSIENKRKTIQHLEGGIVDAILVREGDIVKKGQALIRLDTTGAKATLDRLNAQYWSAKALEERLIAEQKKQPKTIKKNVSEKNNSVSNLNKAVLDQRAIFMARRESIKNRIKLQKYRVAQLKEEILGLEGQIKSGNLQKSLLIDEISNLEILVRKKISRKQPLLILRRRLAEIDGSLSHYKAGIAKIKQKISEANTKIEEIKAKHLNEVVKELQTVRSQLFDLEQRIKAAKDVLERTIIRAPLAGRVFNLRAHTLGGVIKTGLPLLDILPSDGKLIIEAKIDPLDIDVVHPGLKALVNLSASSGRFLKPLEGHVSSVSADRFVDGRTGYAYYLAQIILEDNPRMDLKKIKLYPGMPAEIMVVTGARTALEYLLHPISSSFNRAFRDK